MGRIYAKKAHDVLMSFEGNENSGNSWEHKGNKYFWNIGNEQEQGAITGGIHVYCQEDGTPDPTGEYARRKGSFRIEANGKITRAGYGMKKHLNKDGVGYAINS